MSLRYFWIISLNLRSVLYFRRFANVHKRAQRMGLQDIDITSDNQLIDSVLTSLGINSGSSDDSESQCFQSNQLPVIAMDYKSSHLWPILVVEHKGILFCGYPLCAMNGHKETTIDLIDEKCISLCFTSLQTISRYFTSDKDLSWIEWLMTTMSPFGTLINQNYETLNKLNAKKMTKTESKPQNDCLKIGVNELISRNRDKELNPLHAIHYKCCSDAAKTFLSYAYQMVDIRNDSNICRIQLTLNLRNCTQFKFTYFNVNFKHMSTNSSLNPINSNLTFGQLRCETNGLFWVIGTKFPKSGQIKLSFEINTLNKKLSDIETICNFKVENFQTSLLYANSQHLSVDDLTFNTKLPVIIDSTLTSIDYKLFPEIN
ncbi:unnamed protein product [Oppiella nova]|uniref:Uncharacterized protein n=1 Tax=Oppiella nova TaxID=334625 RepID=A0A7R9QCS1_9ACAR|nr:unnamed protein product [Oppiella nova]CAG2162670.1 unnamed protein product [Oppiella nova]